MLQTKRLFIAVPVPASLKEVFRQYQPVFTHDAVRFLPETNLHLTVYFLGEVPAAQLPEIERALRKITATYAPFNLILESIEPGPHLKSPRLIWARFAPLPAFARLCAEVVSELTNRPAVPVGYIPHITLARFRKDVARPDRWPMLSLPESEYILPVTVLGLWQSELKSPHPVYTILTEFPLLGGNSQNLAG